MTRGISGNALLGLMPATAIVIAANAPATIRQAALEAKSHYGALIQLCDGIDDHIEIQAAIAALPLGGVVHLEGPDFYGQTININNSYISIRALGAVYHLANNTNADVLTIGDGGVTTVSHVNICGLSIDGNRANQAGISHGIHLRRTVLSSLIQNCSIREVLSNGIYLESVSNVTGNQGNVISENHILNFGASGIYVEVGSEANKISGNRISSGVASTKWGIYMNGAYNPIIGNTIFITSGASSAIYLGSSSELCIVEGNGIEFGNFAAIELGGNRATVTGNAILNPGLYGIYIHGNDNLVVSNFIDRYVGNMLYGIYISPGDRNNLVGNRVTASTNDGIRVASGNSTEILGNLIMSAGQTGINVDSNSNNCNISSNTIIQAGLIGIYAAGVGTIISVNTCFLSGHYGVETGATFNGSIVGNIIRNSSQAAAGTYYELYSGGPNTCITNNRLIIDGAIKSGYFGRLDGANSIFMNNVMDGNPVSGLIIIIGVGNSIRNNLGYITENSGASVGTGAQQAIAHGLSFTPTAQQISLTPGSATALPYLSAAPDAHNIYVTATNLQPWYWSRVG